MTGPTPLLFELNRHRRTPLHRQLYDQLREAILTGRLEAGERIPSTRALAEELAVSRTTVLTAVQRLRVEGFLEARVGAGTRVAESLRRELVGRQAREERRVSAGPRLTSRRSAHLRRFAEDIPDFHSANVRRPFQVGVPAINGGSKARWTRLVGRHWRGVESSELGYSGRLGDPVLREAIADYVGLSRGGEGGRRSSAHHFGIAGGTRPGGSRPARCGRGGVD